ncbi:hypothetical protein RV06_GL002361 [Enterococcus haemoperoxidus]|nr:hypothetical protein RV06_GL002361 [Enterococcus haemoperoxidus]
MTIGKNQKRPRYFQLSTSESAQAVSLTTQYDIQQALVALPSAYRLLLNHLQ